MNNTLKAQIKAAFDAEVEALGTTDKVEVEALFGDATTVRQMMEDNDIKADPMEVAEEIDNLIDALNA